MIHRSLSDIIPLSQCVYVIGNFFTLLQRKNIIFFKPLVVLAESGSGKSTFIKSLLKHVQLGKGKIGKPCVKVTKNHSIFRNFHFCSNQ